MYLVFQALLTIFWILDILNLPFMEIFDTVYPVNGLVWFLIWIALPTADVVISKNK